MSRRIVLRDDSAERAVLGVLLLGSVDPRGLSIEREYFWQVRHADIWRAILELRAEGSPIDAITVAARVDDPVTQQLVEELSIPSRVYASSGNVGYHVAILADLARRRSAEKVLLEALDATRSGMAAEKVAQRLAPLQQVNGHKRGGLRTIKMVGVERQEVSWLWRGWIPLGKPSVLDGWPGLGKTWLLLDLAARVTTGRAMPDETASGLDGPATVMVWSFEDDAGDTLRPRIEDAGGDVTRVVLLDQRGDDPEYADLGDVEKIEATLREHDVRLLIVDPMMSALPEGLDGNKDGDMRRLISRWAGVASRTRCAIVFVRHLNKAQVGPAIARGGGSIGIVGGARSAMLVARDPDDDTGDGRVLASTKCNVGRAPASLRFSVTGQPPRIRWSGESPRSADDLVAPPKNAAGASAVTAAEEWLGSILGSIEVESKEIEAEAKAAGMAWSAVRRAKDEMGVRATKRGKAWVWRMPRPEDKG